MVDVFGCHKQGPPGPKGPKGDNGAIVDPTSSYETYVKYINLRKKTLHSILGLVNITSSLSPYPYSYIQSILESSTTYNNFYWLTQSFKDKYIALEFQIPVWLNQIQFVVHAHVSWTLHFTWQYSDDGIIWERIGNEYKKDFTSSIQPPVSSPFEMFTFSQEVPKKKNSRHRYWRMHGLGGNVTDGPYITALFIDLEENSHPIGLKRRCLYYNCICNYE